MTCRTIEKKCQTITAKLPIRFRWTESCVNLWEAGVDYDLGQRVRPSVSNGFEYECTTAGQVNGKKEPNWKSAVTVGATLEDGSVVWTCRLPSTAGLQRRISSSTWFPPTGIVVTNESVTNTAADQDTSALIACSGAVVGQTYRVRNHVVFTDSTEDDAEVDIEVE